MKSNFQWMWSKLDKKLPTKPHTCLPILSSWLSVQPGRWIQPSSYKGRAGMLKKNATEEKNAFTAERSSQTFQLNKKLFNAFHKSDQTSPSLIIPSDLEALPHATPCQDSWENQNPNSKNNEEVLLKARRGYSACFPFSLRGDFKNYVLCYP